MPRHILRTKTAVFRANAQWDCTNVRKIAITMRGIGASPGRRRMLTLTMTAARPHSGWVGAGGPHTRGPADVVGQRGPRMPT